MDADGQVIGLFEEVDCDAEVLQRFGELGDRALAHAVGAIDGDGLFGEACGGGEEAGGGAGSSPFPFQKRQSPAGWES